MSMMMRGSVGLKGAAAAKGHRRWGSPAVSLLKGMGTGLLGVGDGLRWWLRGIVVWQSEGTVMVNCRRDGRVCWFCDWRLGEVRVVICELKQRHDGYGLERQRRVCLAVKVHGGKMDLRW
ncbi:hypothetical protein M0R45_030777 [Rubus argutus]|uniref:Uncharacterized protein n=1 Tax=Rubus argutus TaxID=59490 RepID=A0AAW1WG39_RUBAR